MINVEQVFVLVGVILTLFFATLLLISSKYKSPANKLLAFSLVTLSLIILRISELLVYTFLAELFEFLRIEYLFSVFLYLYVCATLKQRVKPLTYFVLAIPFILFSAIYSIASITEWSGHTEITDVLEYIEPFEIYIIILFNLLVVVLYTLKVKRSKAEANFKKWTYIISTGLVAILISFLALEFIELWFDKYFWDYLAAGISIFFAYITYIGVQQLQVERELKTIRSINKTAKSVAIPSKRKVVLNHFENMQRLMQDEDVYKNPNLDRETFGTMLGLSASSVTRILKEEGQISFNDFVSQYRIHLAKTMLKDERLNIFSLEAIGKEVGFKSRSAFYERFKKDVGISPGAFKKA